MRYSIFLVAAALFAAPAAFAQSTPQTAAPVGPSVAPVTGSSTVGQPGTPATPAAHYHHIIHRVVHRRIVHHRHPHRMAHHHTTTAAAKSGSAPSNTGAPEE